MNRFIWNKSINESLRYWIQQYRTNHLLYKEVLNKHYSHEDISKCSILFFMDHYLNQNKYNDFRRFLFGMFDTLLSNKPCPNDMFLATRQYRMFFIHKLNPDTIVIFSQIANHSVFYNVMMRSETQENQFPPHFPLSKSYLIKNNKKRKDDAFVSAIFSLGIYNYPLSNNDTPEIL